MHIGGKFLIRKKKFLVAKLFVNIALKELAYCHFTITDLNKNPNINMFICTYSKNMHNSSSYLNNTRS